MTAAHPLQTLPTVPCAVIEAVPDMAKQFAFYETLLGGSMTSCRRIAGGAQG